jgi:hypothetical protein
MYTNRRAILSLVAQGRISPSEAERLIAVCSSGREAWWLLAGCALCAGLVQLHALTGLQPHALAGLVHLFRPATVGSMHALHHAMAQVVTLSGENQ